MPDPVLTRKLEITPSAEGEEGNQGATASMKETVRKEGIEDPPTWERKEVPLKTRRG